MKKSYFLDLFKSLGFIFKYHYIGNYDYIWHCFNDNYIGYKRYSEGQNAIKFIFIVHRNKIADITFEHTFHENDLEDYKLLFNALKNPKDLPLCVGISWLSSFVSILFNHYSSLTSAIS